MLQDDEIFQVFEKCRQLGGIAMVHAENGSVITELEKEMSQLGITGPEGHLLSRPEKVKSAYLYVMNISICLSLKLKQQIVQLQLLKRLGKRFIVCTQFLSCLFFLLRCPLYVVHVMSKTAADKVTEARLKGRI